MHQKPVLPSIKPWGRRHRDLPAYALDKIYQLRNQLDRSSQARLGLLMKIPVYIKDPLKALEDHLSSIQEITLGFENGIADGPTSARIAVVDFNGDTQKLTPPVIWDGDTGWFQIPPEDQTTTQGQMNLKI